MSEIKLSDEMFQISLSVEVETDNMLLFRLPYNFTDTMESANFFELHQEEKPSNFQVLVGNMSNCCSVMLRVI